MTPEGNVDELTPIRQQRPDVLRGGVYFDFWDNQYRLLHSRETTDGNSAIYHEGQIQCNYFLTSDKLKSAPAVELPDHTSSYMYWSGPF